MTVEAAPAEREEISEMVTGEAVVFPVQQSVITPKITSTIREFLVQRGSKVHKGQLLAILENADLAAAAEQSKGEFEQAEASYATTVGAGVPQEMQKAELDAAAAKAGYEAAQKVYDSRKELVSARRVAAPRFGRRASGFGTGENAVRCGGAATRGFEAAGREASAEVGGGAN